MPDITMCSIEGCRKAKTCYRFKAKPSKYGQSYFMGNEPDRKTTPCEYYWRVRKD